MASLERRGAGHKYGEWLYGMNAAFSTDMG